MAVLNAVNYNSKEVSSFLSFWHLFVNNFPCYVSNAEGNFVKIGWFV